MPSFLVNKSLTALVPVLDSEIVFTVLLAVFTAFLN
jgi:hypothetical protein